MINFGLNDTDVLNIKLIHDFITFINYVENNKVKLTATGKYMSKRPKSNKFYAKYKRKMGTKSRKPYLED